MQQKTEVLKSAVRLTSFSTEVCMVFRRQYSCERGGSGGGSVGGREREGGGGESQLSDPHFLTICLLLAKRL